MKNKKSISSIFQQGGTAKKKTLSSDAFMPASEFYYQMGGLAYLSLGNRVLRAQNGFLASAVNAPAAPTTYQDLQNQVVGNYVTPDVNKMPFNWPGAPFKTPLLLYNILYIIYIMGEVCPLNLTVKTPFLGVVVGRKPGKQNIPKDAAQKQVLELLSQGTTITDAMAAVGRNDVTFRQWSLTDPDFKAEADKARLAGKGVKADMANLKDISFEEFSEQFLDTKLFDHHKDWVDLIEGREPRWLHPAMTYEPAASNRVLINVPPEHCG